MFCWSSHGILKSLAHSFSSRFTASVRRLVHCFQCLHYKISLWGFLSSFEASFNLVHGSVFGEPWLLTNVGFFMWLVMHYKCWTADRLARRGLQYHKKCLLCDQGEETINHLLVSCVFSRHLWFELFEKFGLQNLALQMADPSFEVWWCWSSEIAAGQDRQALNSLIILGAWSLWTHWNW